jgi:hypothetical protein
MASLGVFRDDFYNGINVLTDAQTTITAQAAGVLSAQALASAVENYVTVTVATALTTDTALNIIASLQQAVAAAYKAQIAGLGAQVNPPLGTPNLFNMTFFVSIQTTAAGLTVTGGTGVTFVSGTGVTSGASTVTTGTTRSWIVSVTSSNTVVFTTTGQVLTTP